MLEDAESVLDADRGLGLALASSSSLRALHVQDGVGPVLMATFGQMGAACSLRKLTIAACSPDGNAIEPPLLPALMGLRATLEELVIWSVDDPIEIDINKDDGMIWSAVHTIKLASDWEQTPELVKTFPNLRHLFQKEDHLGFVDEARERSHALAMCWPSLDTVALESRALWAAGLNCPVRKLIIGYIISRKAIRMLLEDLPVLRPVVLDLALDMPSALYLGDQPKPYPIDGERLRDVTAVDVAPIWLNLPRTKTLRVHIRGWADSLTFEEVDEYMVRTTHIDAHAEPFPDPLLSILSRHRFSYPNWSFSNFISSCGTLAFGTLLGTFRRMKSCCPQDIRHGRLIARQGHPHLRRVIAHVLHRFSNNTSSSRLECQRIGNRRFLTSSQQLVLLCATCVSSLGPDTRFGTAIATGRFFE
jgi:hypothetical protein